MDIGALAKPTSGSIQQLGIFFLTNFLLDRVRISFISHQKDDFFLNKPRHEDIRHWRVSKTVECLCQTFFFLFSFLFFFFFGIQNRLLKIKRRFTFTYSLVISKFVCAWQNFFRLKWQWEWKKNGGFLFHFNDYVAFKSLQSTFKKLKHSWIPDYLWSKQKFHHWLCVVSSFSFATRERPKQRRFIFVCVTIMFIEPCVWFGVHRTSTITKGVK